MIWSMVRKRDVSLIAFVLMVSITRSNWPQLGDTRAFSLSRQTLLCIKTSCRILPALRDRIETEKGQLVAVKTFSSVGSASRRRDESVKLDYSKSQTCRVIVTNSTSNK
jgi:hypothetical protein